MNDDTIRLTRFKSLVCFEVSVVWGEGSLHGESWLRARLIRQQLPQNACQYEVETRVTFM